MTQFTFSELKPRIEEEIKKRSKPQHDHFGSIIYTQDECIACNHRLGRIFYNDEPIELVDKFIVVFDNRLISTSTIDSTLMLYYSNIKVEAIGKRNSQVYTWSLKALLPELFIDNKI